MVETWIGTSYTTNCYSITVLFRENKIGQVPLHIAARFGHIKSLKFLLNLGVDISKTVSIAKPLN